MRKDMTKQAEEFVSRLSAEQQAEQLKYNAPAIEELNLPAYNYWNEALHGVARAGTATVFPQAIGLASMFDDKLLYEVADVISTEARAKYNSAVKSNDRDIYKGLTFWSPNVNIFRDPRWGRGHETYGEDPFLTAKLGVAFVKGMQGDSEYLKTAACAKHFAVHSGPELLRHEFDAEVSQKDLNETYLPAFKALVTEAKVEAVMGAYNRVNGEPACANTELMRILRKDWGFDGHFVSDCWAISDFHAHHKITKTAPESAALALKKGCDLNCGNTYLHILSALQEGLIGESDITKACVNVMRTRFRLGMFTKTKYDDIPFDVVDCEKHNALSRKCAEKSMVLLKNNGILPLDKSLESLAVIGPNADSRAVLYGNYNGTSSCPSTFLEGIRGKFSGRVYYSQGCHLYKDKIEGLSVPDDRISEAVAVAQVAQAVILCVGLDASLEGEEGDTSNEYASGDKKTLLLPPPQQKLINAVLSVGKPTVIVLSSGSSVNVNVNPDALIQTWYTGSFGGKALADILFGDVSPSGKLPVTFYENTELLPDFCDYSMKNRTYRYAENNVQYPFGFGLTYSDIELSDASFSGDTLFCAGYGRTDLPGGNMREMADSLIGLMALPGNTRVLPGHGGETTIGSECRRYGR